MLGVGIVVVLKDTGQRATCEREGDNSDDHDKDAEDLFHTGSDVYVAVSYCCDSLYSEVNRCQILLSRWHFDDISLHPSSSSIISKLRCHNPETSHNVNQYEERKEKSQEPLHAHTNIKKLFHIFGELTFFLYHFEDSK